MSPRKLVKDMTPEDLETYRAKMREAKRKSRAKAKAEGRPPEVDKRTAEQRRDENRIRQQQYRAKKKAESEK